MFKLAEAVVEFKTAGLATVTGGVRSLLGVFGDLTSTLLKASGVAVGLGSAFGAFSALKLAAQAEQAQVAMGVLVGSADKARTLLDALYARAGRTPFEIDGLTKAAQTMLGFGIATEEVLPNLDMLSEVAMGNKDKLQSLALAFGQVKAAGRLMGQEVLQFINAGFNPLQEISRRTGESMADLRDRMQKGKVSFEEVRQAFAAATSEGGRFHGMNERLNQTLMGLWNRTTNEIRMAFMRIGRVLAESIDFKALGAKIEGWVNTLADTFEVLATDWRETWEIMKLYTFGVIEQIKEFLAQVMSAAGAKTVSSFKAAWEAIKVATTIGDEELRREQERDKVEMAQAQAQEDFAKDLLKNRPELGLTQRDVTKFVLANAEHKTEGRIWDLINGVDELGGKLPEEEVERFNNIMRLFGAELNALAENQLGRFVELRQARLEAQSAGKMDTAAIDAAGKGFFDEARRRFEELKRRHAEALPVEAPPVEQAPKGMDLPMVPGIITAMMTQLGFQGLLGQLGQRRFGRAEFAGAQEFAQRTQQALLNDRMRQQEEREKEQMKALKEIAKHLTTGVLKVDVLKAPPVGLPD